MTALSAARTKKCFKPFYDRLISSAKKPKVALAAVMRKVIVCVNTMIAKEKLWQVTM